MEATLKKMKEDQENQLEQMMRCQNEFRQDIEQLWELQKGLTKGIKELKESQEIKSMKFQIRSNEIEAEISEFKVTQESQNIQIMKVRKEMKEEACDVREEINEVRGSLRKLAEKIDLIYEWQERMTRETKDVEVSQEKVTSNEDNGSLPSYRQNFEESEFHFDDKGKALKGNRKDGLQAIMGKFSYGLERIFVLEIIDTLKYLLYSIGSGIP